MSVESDVYLVISLTFAVFAAVAAVGTSLVLGVGFERLRSGFELVRKQTAFFSDAIYKLDQKTNDLDHKTVTLDIRTRALEAEQLEPRRAPEKQEAAEAEGEHISAGVADTLLSKAENLLTEMSFIAGEIKEQKNKQRGDMLEVPQSMAQHILMQGQDGKMEQIRFH